MKTYLYSNGAEEAVAESHSSEECCEMKMAVGEDVSRSSSGLRIGLSNARSGPFSAGAGSYNHRHDNAWSG